MKKTLLISAASSAVVSLVVVLLLHFALPSGKNGTSTVRAKFFGADSVAITPSMMEGGIAYVNIDSLVRGYDMYYDLQQEFEAAARRKDTDFNSRMRRFENDVRDFQEKLEKGLVTRSQAAQLQEGLARRQQELQNLQQRLQMELAEEEGVMLRQIQNSIQTYVQEYNATKGYSLILSTSGNSVVLYGQPGLNITTEVLKGLNESYVKAKRK